MQSRFPPRALLAGAVAVCIAACDRSERPAASTSAPEESTSTSPQTAPAPETQPPAVAEKKLPVTLTWEPGKPIPECALADADWEQRQKWSREDRETCWRKKGIWPYAPALTDAEWSELDIEQLSIEELDLLVGRAVTGDLCAVLDSSETDPMKRWSPAVWVEGNIAIWVVEGEGAHGKASSVYEATGAARIGNAGVISCDEGIAIMYVGGANDRVSTIAGLMLDKGVQVKELASFAVSSNEEIVEKCLEGQFWPERCALLMHRNLVNPQRCSVERASDGKPGVLCAGSRRFLKSYVTRNQR